MKRKKNEFHISIKLWDFDFTSANVARIFFSVNIHRSLLPDIIFKLNNINTLNSYKNSIDWSTISNSISRNCCFLALTHERRPWMECEELLYDSHRRVSGTRFFFLSSKIPNSHMPVCEWTPLFCIDPSHSISRWKFLNELKSNATVFFFAFTRNAPKLCVCVGSSFVRSFSIKSNLHSLTRKEMKINYAKMLSCSTQCQMGFTTF